MATFVVTKVRKEQSADGSHRHIEGVCTTNNSHYTRQSVVDSINAGNSWTTFGGGLTATIEVISECPKAGCNAKPYIKTKPDSTKLDNLENLPEC